MNSLYNVNKVALFQIFFIFSFFTFVPTVFGAVGSITNLAPTSVTQTSVTLNAFLSGTGGVSSVSRGFQWGTNISFGATTTESSSSFSVGKFSANLTSLVCGTEYYYRPYFINASGLAYGDTVDFVTSGCHEYYVSPTGSPSGNGSISNPWDLQTALNGAGGVILGGDFVWLRAGTYSPGGTTNSVWNVGFSGTSGHPVVWRSHTGELAKIDKQWRFGNSQYHTFRDIEFYDSDKGNHVNQDYPRGPWLHFDGASAGFLNIKWINVIVHDVSNAWSGGTCDTIRGSMIWYVGLTNLDHVCYPGKDFIGNVVGWHVTEVMNLSAPASTVRSNIIFGGGQLIRGSDSGDLRMSSDDATITGNYFYNRYAEHILSRSIMIGAGTNRTNATVENNTIVAPIPIFFAAVPVDNISFTGNTVHMNSTYALYPVIRGYFDTGSWIIDNNFYTAQSTMSVVLEKEKQAGGSDRYNFTDWKVATGMDSNSTSADSSFPTDSVNIIPDVDTAKRANIAVYNFTQAATVTADVSKVLNVGDTYSLYSAQNYNDGPIQTGTLSGSTINIPMTGHSVAPVLFGASWAGTAPDPALYTPPLTSPEFGAFILVGSAPAGGDEDEDPPVVDPPPVIDPPVVEPPATPPPPAPSSSGSRRSGSGGSRISPITVVDTVTKFTSTSTTTVPTIIYTNTISVGTLANFQFSRTLSLGSSGDDVRKLQAFLNWRGFRVAEIGIGSQGSESTYFGPATKAALIKYQNAYPVDILKPAGLSVGNGIMGQSTINKINSSLRVYGNTVKVYIPGTSSSVSTYTTPASSPVTVSTTFKRSLTIGSTGEDVRSLQKFLNSQGFIVASSGMGSKGYESTYFGPATAKALSRFQANYGISPAAGFFGPITMRKVNELIK